MDTVETLSRLNEMELLDTIGSWEREYKATMLHAEHCIRQLVLLKAARRRQTYGDVAQLDRAPLYESDC